LWLHVGHDRLQQVFGKPHKCARAVMPVKLHMDEMAAGGRSFKWASDKTHLVEQVFLLLHRSALYRSVHRVAKHDQVEAFSFQHPDRQSGCVLWTEAPFASAQAHGLTADPGQARWIKSSPIAANLPDPLVTHGASSALQIRLSFPFAG
jgi:hypothetical protein